MPGTAQDVRAYLLLMQYWLAGSDSNIEQMMRYLIDRYATGRAPRSRARSSPRSRSSIPKSGLWHPALKGRGITKSCAICRQWCEAGTVGVLVGRSYLLAGNTAHYAAVVKGVEARGLRVIAGFSSALDARPAIEKFFKDGRGQATDRCDDEPHRLLAGGWARVQRFGGRAGGAQALDVPYSRCRRSSSRRSRNGSADARGLNPLQATLQIAIPELDGAIVPTVYGGKGRRWKARPAASEPIPERVERVAERVARLVALRRKARAERKIAIILFNFPPNAGNTGSGRVSRGVPVAAAHARGDEGGRAIASTCRRAPTSCASASRRAIASSTARRPTCTRALRWTIMCAARSTSRRSKRRGARRPASSSPMGSRCSGDGLQFGNVFIGVQPSFGWEGDPMRLLFEGNFSPTHAFSAFYRWLAEDYKADAVLHFGTHGALEFMPGKQAGLDDRCWPDRLIGDLPNVYLYASNNSSEGTLAKRRGNATLVSYLTPPITNAGLYKGLLELKTTLDRWRQLDKSQADDAATLRALVQQQAAAVELAAAEPAWRADDTDAHRGAAARAAARTRVHAHPARPARGG
jgi:magnesium chelatase subunit H